VKLLMTSALVALGALVACNRDSQPRPAAQPTPQSASSALPTALPTPDRTLRPPPWRAHPSDVLPRRGPGDSPAVFIAGYVRLLDTGPRCAAVSLWLDGATVPRAGITISFKPEGEAHPADRTGMGMGTNAWRYITAVPGQYTETTRNGHVSTSN
jgi:hypothetical protein